MDDLGQLGLPLNDCILKELKKMAEKDKNNKMTWHLIPEGEGKNSSKRVGLASFGVMYI